MRQLSTKIADIIGSGMTLRLKRDEYIGVAGANSAGSVIHVVKNAVRQADIVQDAGQFLLGNFRANRPFHQVTKHRDIFNSRTRLAAHMKDELAAVSGRKKVLPQPSNQQGGGKTNHKESGNKKDSRPNQVCQKPLVCLTKAFKVAVERF